MTLQQLEYVVALAEEQHFSKAATRCNVTQPTLSTMVQRLEEELQVELFDRTKHPIKTTALGEQLVKQARRILSEASKISGIVDDTVNSLSGVVNVGILPTIAPYLMPLVLPRWLEQFKSMKINVKELKTKECYAALSRWDIDLAIIASEPESDDFDGSLLYYEEFLGYVSANYKTDMPDKLFSSDIIADKLWLLAEGHCFRDQLLRFCQLSQRSKFPISYKEGSIAGFMHLVESGHGLTFIPALAELYLSSEQKALVKRFAIPRPARAIWLVYRKDYMRERILQAMTQTLRAAVPEEMLTLAREQSLAK